MRLKKTMIPVPQKDLYNAEKKRRKEERRAGVAVGGLPPQSQEEEMRVSVNNRSSVCRSSWSPSSCTCRVVGGRSWPSSA
jgi:rRNA pseudouridine-1189 N-methylase Emg1 (Nep1/Mra1 family)